MKSHLPTICSGGNHKKGAFTMILLKILSLVIWLVIIPFCMGLLPALALPEGDRTKGSIFVSGYILLFALFELVGIPVVVLVVYHGFTLLSWIFAGVSLLTALLGVLLTVRQGKQKAGGGNWHLPEKPALSMEEKIGYLLFFLLAAFQMYMAFTRASFDGDDAYYGVQGLIAQQYDTLYRINPNTGRSSPLDVRHALALIPVWEAFLGRMSGIHMTIIAHSVVPLVLIPLTYLVYYQIGKKLFYKKKDMLPVFMILMAVFQMFGNVSIYTGETFFLTRTWQGKSIAGNFIIPAVFWIFLSLFAEREDKKEKGYFFLLAALNLAAGVSSSLAVLLSTLLSAGLALLFSMKERRIGILVKTGLCCIPGAAYVLVYLLISR
jgi:hypothetical protein